MHHYSRQGATKLNLNFGTANEAFILRTKYVELLHICSQSRHTSTQFEHRPNNRAGDFGRPLSSDRVIIPVLEGGCENYMPKGQGPFSVRQPPRRTRKTYWTHPRGFAELGPRGIGQA